MGTQDINNVKIDIIDTKPCSVILNVEISHPAVADETEKVFDAIQKEARMPGFRPGKAPIELVRKNYVSTAREQVIQNLIRQTVFPSLKSKGIEPIDFPVIEEVSFDFDKPLSFRMKAERHPEFKIKDYKGIKITRVVHPVTDEKVASNLEGLRERNARLSESKTETVGPEHFVMVDYECFRGTEPIENLKTKNQMIDLSSPQMIAGFKEGLLGAAKGEEREIKVTFPAEYPDKKIAGQEVNFKVKVLQIKEKILPVLDDEFAKDLGLSNRVELENKVRETLESEEKKRQSQEVEKQIIGHLLAVNNFPVPESLVEEQFRAILHRVESYFKRQGIPEAEWKKNEDKWHEKYRAEAERNVRVSYILNAIAREEKIEVSDRDLQQEKERLLSTNPGRENDVVKYFDGHKDHIASSMKEERILAFLLQNAKVKEETKKD